MQRTRGGWRNRRARGGFVAAFVVAGVAITIGASSCRDPTEVTVVVTTHSKCGDEIGATALYVGASPEGAHDLVQSHSPQADTSHCDNGDIGTLVVTHGSASGAIVVIAGYKGKSPTDCVDGNYVNCIVARRTFAFVDHTPLTIPISLDVDCLNVPCDKDSTCFQGQCHGASVSCSDNGSCTDPKQNPVVDAGPMLQPDGQPMSTDDAMAGDDAMSKGDAGDLDAGIDDANGSDGNGGSVDSGFDGSKGTDSGAMSGTPVCVDDGSGSNVLYVNYCGGTSRCTTDQVCCTNSFGSAVTTCNAHVKCISTPTCCMDIQCGASAKCCINSGDAGPAGDAAAMTGVDSGKAGCVHPSAGSAPGTCQP